MLYDYPWPGNVRELESAIERATILCDSDTIVEYDLPLAVQAFADGAEVSLPATSVFDNRNTIIPMESLKEQAVRHALKVTEGNVGDAARKLKISRSTMYELMKRFDVQMQAAA
jgi:DNA-binding NtrC family response regulator